MMKKFRIEAYGPMGSGKTLALDSLAKTLAEKGIAFTHNREKHFIEVEADDEGRKRLAGASQ